MSWETIVRRMLQTLWKLHNHENKVWTDVDTGHGVKYLGHGFKEGKGKVK